MTELTKRKKQLQKNEQVNKIERECLGFALNQSRTFNCIDADTASQLRLRLYRTEKLEIAFKTSVTNNTIEVTRIK